MRVLATTATPTGRPASERAGPWRAAAATAAWCVAGRDGAAEALVVTATATTAAAAASQMSQAGRRKPGGQA